jgi:cardiolipin synthase
MKLLIQPRDGFVPVLKAIKKARRRIGLVLFRLDRPELSRALIEAVERGVIVYVLVAFTNRGGAKKLRKLETELLSKGVLVSRTDDNLLRYHGKMMLVDAKELYLFAFNFTAADLRSRSFGVVTSNPKLVREATRLITTDIKRQPFKSRNRHLVVSPVNAREVLSSFLRQARKELLIYDPKLSDPEFIKLLQERENAGVRIRILGKVKSKQLRSRGFHSMRLHTRTIIRDRSDVFVGSQSLRAEELDQRREIGIIVHDGKIIDELVETFEQDWKVNKKYQSKRDRPRARKVAKAVARHISRGLTRPVIKKVVRTVTDGQPKKQAPDKKRLEAAVKKALDSTLKHAAKEALEEVA